MKKVILLLVFMTVSILTFAQKVSDATMGTYNNTYIKAGIDGGIRANSHNTFNRYLIASKVNKDSLDNVRILSDTTMEVVYKGVKDTVRFLPYHDEFWTLKDNSTITTSFNIYTDSSFLMNRDLWRFGYLTGNPYSIGSDTILMMGYRRSDASQRSIIATGSFNDGTYDNYLLSATGAGAQNYSLISQQPTTTQINTYRLGDGASIQLTADSSKMYQYNSDGDMTSVNLYPDSVVVHGDVYAKDLPESVTDKQVYYNESTGHLSYGDTTSGGGTNYWTLTGSDISNNNAGKIGIGTSTPIAKFHVLGNSYFNSTNLIKDDLVEPFYFEGEYDTINGNHYNLRSVFRYDSDDSTGFRIGGILGEAYTDTTCNDIGWAVGSYGYVQHFGQSSTINQAASFFTGLGNRYTGTINNAYGMIISQVGNAGGGTVNNAYGIYMYDSPGIANKWGVYMNGAAKNYFGGNLTFGTNLYSTDSTGVINLGPYNFLHAYRPNLTAIGGNTFCGVLSGNFTLTSSSADQGSYNTGVGWKSLNGLTTGYANISVGYESGLNISSGYGNVAIGHNSLRTLTTASKSVAVGYMAGFTNNENTLVAIGSEAGRLSTGLYNNFIGYQAGDAVTTGSGNHFMGTNAGGAVTEGNYNVAIGYDVLSSITTGSNNIALGFRAGYTNNTSDGNNTFIGHQAGYSNTGSSNVFLGYRSGYKETGSYKGYIAADSTSFLNGMASGSKLAVYWDMSNANKANHTINIFAKTAIGSAAAPTNTLEVTGSVGISTFLKLTPTADPPGGATEGMIYADTDHHLYYYNGSGWVSMTD